MAPRLNILLLFLSYWDVEGKKDHLVVQPQQGAIVKRAILQEEGMKNPKKYFEYFLSGAVLITLFWVIGVIAYQHFL